jgi:hypothetical protein
VGAGKEERTIDQIEYGSRVAELKAQAIHSLHLVAAGGRSILIESSDFGDRCTLTLGEDGESHSPAASDEAIVQLNRSSVVARQKIGGDEKCAGLVGQGGRSFSWYGCGLPPSRRAEI